MSSPAPPSGLELLRRGHEVRMAVPPNLVGFVESAGLAAVAYGPDSWSCWTRISSATLEDPESDHVAARSHGALTQGWAEMSTTLTSLADGADLLLTGMPLPGARRERRGVLRHSVGRAANFPQRVNGQSHSACLPSPLIRSGLTVACWLYWRMTKQAEDAQRRELGLPKATGPSTRRIMERGSLEIQTYDELCFPEVAAEWGGRRPFVGALTMELTTDCRR